MSFLSRSGQQKELGSGGKALHGRTYPPRYSPYNRPSSSAAPLALFEPKKPEARGTASWFRSLISGAGKVISSFLGSDESCSSSECSSDYSSEGEYEPLPNELGNHLLSDDVAGSNKRGSVVEGDVETIAIVCKSESKLVIEQLLLQETFTRDEYIKLMEILRSQVLDIPSVKGGEVIHEEVSEQVSEKSPWQSLNKKWNISAPSNISPSNLSAFTPRYYASEAVTPDLRDKAVMEAKKWFEEKKLTPSPICDQECGPCMLNSDMNQYCFNSDNTSPVEMAKSYMQSLPPWRSPSFSTSCFKNPSSSGKHTYCSSASHLLQSSKVNERAYSAIGSLQSSGVSLKSVADERGSSKLKRGGSTTVPPLFEDSSGRDIFSAELLRLHDREAVKVGHLLDTHTKISQDMIAEPQVAFKAQELPKIASENFIEQPQSDIDGILLCDSDVFMSDKNQDVEMPPVIESQVDSISAPHDSLPMFSMTDRNDDSQPPESNHHIPKGAVVTQEETNTNGHLEETKNTNSGLGSVSCDAAAASVSEGTYRPPSDVSGEIPSTQAISSSAGKHPNGTKMKSTERICTETSQLGRGRRTAKKVVRQKKWKG